MLDHPDHDMLMRDFGPRFAESPWEPGALEAPFPTSITAAIDVIKRDIALAVPTQLMEVIGDA